MTGFGMKLWDDLSFGAIWMSAAMDLNHPEAETGEEAAQLCRRGHGSRRCGSIWRSARS